MTVLDAVVCASGARLPRTRHYVMCAPGHSSPDHVSAGCTIGPSTDPTGPSDHGQAALQWEILRNTYLSLGHTVDLVPPLAGQPDMVFAAHGGVVVADRAYGARSTDRPAYTDWLRNQGIVVTEPSFSHEGQGDFLALGSMILAGTGFGTSLSAHIEAAEALDRPVVSLQLRDPRFCHLDVALTVLDDGNGESAADVAYYPGAFNHHSRRTLRDLFPAATIVSEADALALGLNAVSDGRNVVLAAAAVGFARQLTERGYTPVPVDLAEFLKSGAGVKCCTMERHR